MRRFFMALLCTAASITAIAQRTVPYLGKINWINGYAKELSGETIRYYSAYPDYATTALLTRATDGKKAIVWQTDKVPADVKGPYVYFSWVAAHSSATNSGERHFDLYVDDERLLSFTTLPGNKAPTWSVGAADSSRLVFEQTRQDGARDAHGLAFLRLPVSRVRPGQPVTLKIVGQAQHSNDWYMTFKFTFEEKIDAIAPPFILRGGKQPITLTALHFGAARSLTIDAGRYGSISFPVQEGINTMDIPVDAVAQKDSIRLKVMDGKRVLSDRFVTLQPVIRRELHFIHHSHTDIGYSHLQPEVLKIHLRNIDDALQMIAATRNYPPEARFKWNIESLWVVEHYLRQATPAQRSAFVAAVKEGSICLSALYANMLTGLSLPEELFHYTDYAAQLRQQYGFAIPSAMISDVPGYTWTTVTALAKGGVKYFSSGPNYLGEGHPNLGDRVGHFVRHWGDKPVWWVSPSGEEKILFWTAGKGYSSWHGTAPGAVFERGKQHIAQYLQLLADSSYPYEMVQWRYNVVADNGPIDTAVSRFVKEWNEHYQSPKIVLNTTDQLFATFEQRYGKQLPVIKGDITPYWEDGAGSTAQEEGQNRRTSLHLQQLTNAYAILGAARYDAQRFYEAWTNVLLFHEHTWGAHNSISQPEVPFVTEQWRIKRQFMQDAYMQAEGLSQALLQPITDSSSRRIVVVNTLSWERSGPVKIAVAGKSVKDAQGRRYPLQTLQDGGYVFVAKGVPPFGTAVYEVTDVPVRATETATLRDHVLSNQQVQVGWDTVHGSITRLSKAGGRNYAGQFREQGLNSYWYVPGLDPAQATSNHTIQTKIIDQGPVVTTVALSGSAPGTQHLERRLSLYAGSDQVLVENVIDKQAIREKEAVHFGFPFDVPAGAATLDAGYGTLRYVTDQLPGSNMDFLYGRRWMDVSAGGDGVQWLLLETPMVEPGQMTDERRVISQSHRFWRTSGAPTSTWFSYVMNNYWHTNYKADQSGVSRYHYALRPHHTNDGAAMERAAADFTQPLLAIPVKAGVQLPRSLFQLSNPALSVTSITPQAGGRYLIRVFNPQGDVQETSIQWDSIRPGRLVRVADGKAFSPADRISLAAMGVAEFELLP